MSGEEGWPAHSRGPVHSLLGAPARDCADEDGAWWGHVTPWNVWCSLLLPWQIDFRFLHGHLAGTQACAVLLVGSGPVVHLSLLLRVLPQGLLWSFPAPGAIVVHLYSLQ